MAVSIEQMKEELKFHNPDALLADGFDKALIGVANVFGRPPLAVYDYEMCVLILVHRDKMSHEDALDFFEYNVVGAWVGENTPIFVHIFRNVL